MHPITLAKIQLRQRLACPSRFPGNLIIRQMQITRKQTACIFRLLLAQIFRTHIPRPQILKKSTFNHYRLPLQLSGKYHYYNQQYRNSKDKTNRQFKQSGYYKHHKRNCQQNSQHDSSYQWSAISPTVAPQCYEFYRMVFLNHDSSQKRRNKQNNDQSRQ